MARPDLRTGARGLRRVAPAVLVVGGRYLRRARARRERPELPARYSGLSVELAQSPAWQL